MTVVSEIIGVVLEAITTFLGGIGSSILDLFDNLLVTAEGGLTNLATYGLVFVGLGFAISLFYMLFSWIARR